MRVGNNGIHGDATDDKGVQLLVKEMKTPVFILFFFFNFHSMVFQFIMHGPNKT